MLAKSYIQVRIAVGNFRPSLREMDEKLKCDHLHVEQLAMVTRTSSSNFFFSKFLDYMKHYMMLHQQCGHKLVKGLATVPQLDEDPIQVRLVT